MENYPEIKNDNDRIIFAHLYFSRYRRSRGDLHDDLGIPRSTLFDALDRLRRRKLIKRITERRTTRGRPHIYYEAIS